MPHPDLLGVRPEAISAASSRSSNMESLPRSLPAWARVRVARVAMMAMVAVVIMLTMVAMVVRC